MGKPFPTWYTTRWIHSPYVHIELTCFSFGLHCICLLHTIVHCVSVHFCIQCVVVCWNRCTPPSADCWRNTSNRWCRGAGTQSWFVHDSHWENTGSIQVPWTAGKEDHLVLATKERHCSPQAGLPSYMGSACWHSGQAKHCSKPQNPSQVLWTISTAFGLE